MQKWISSSLFLVSTFISANEREFSRGITSCLLIKDYSSAIHLGKAGLEAFPKSKEISELIILSLAESGEGMEALRLFEKEFKDRPLKENFSLLESIAWGMLLHNEEKAEMGKISAIIGASLTHDSRAVDLILKALDSSNMLLRTVALRVAPQYNDRVVQKRVLTLLREERDWHVRLEIVQAVGYMQLKEAVPFLKEIVASSSATQEEKVSAIHALVNIYEDISDKDLELLLTHNRSGMRELGVAIIDHFNKKEKITRILPLLKDPSPYVRTCVLAALGTMDVEDRLILAEKSSLDLLMKEGQREVSLLAAWVKLRISEEEARAFLMECVASEDLALARFAAVMLGASGKAGEAVLFQLLQQAKDPYIKANLALGMIKQKVEVEKAISCLKDFFLETKEEIMWQDGVYPMFTILVPSKVYHVGHMPRYPSLIDHLTRLDLLNILCVAGCTESTELVKQFLSKQMWGVVTGASALLIGEGDKEALGLIHGLLNDENEDIKIQAALVLAFYGKDPKVVTILEHAYTQVDWERKIQILEAIGFIGSRDSIPFLLEVMKEPFSLLRTIAASGVIQCLYH